MRKDAEREKNKHCSNAAERRPMAQAWEEWAKTDQFKHSRTDSVAIEGLRATFSPVRGIGWSGSDKKMFVCQVESSGRR